MPRIYGSGKEFKGNSNSGRKPRGVEIKQYAEILAEKTIQELAEKQVAYHLKEQLNFQKTKEMALPIVLRGIKETKDVNVNLPKPLLDAVRNHNSPAQNTEAVQEDQGNSGRNVSE